VLADDEQGDDMNTQEARDLVDDLCQACVDYERAAMAQSRKAGEHYRALVDRVVDALTSHKHGSE
jgi:polyhydroxyalkanoate synthesis regulator phasin